MEPDSFPALTAFMVTAAPFIALFFGVLAILWFLLPFAVFGVKKRLDQTNNLLAQIQKELHAQNSGRSLDSSPTPHDRVEPPTLRP